ncbi:MAG: acyltransferase family protein [Bacteroidales bacterium]|nr:acyltransferase family protein [Bacteroidales bacterium]
MKASLTNSEINPPPTVAKKQRIEFIDLMKGICILMVVFGHIENSPDDTWFDCMLQATRMPLYFFLSGLFFKTYSGLPEFSLKKINKLIIPFLFFYSIACILTYIKSHALLYLGKEFTTTPFKWAYVIEPLFTERFHYNKVLWFLICLFEVNILYYILNTFLKTRMKWITIIALSALAWYLGRNGIDLPYFLDSAMIALPFFGIGHTLGTSGLLFHKKFDKWGYLSIGIFIAILFFIAEPLDIYKNIYPSNYFYMYTASLCGIAILLLLCKWIKYIPVISFFGTYSIIILGTHNILISPIRTVIYKYMGETNTANWTIFIIIILISLILIPILTRTFPSLTAQKELIPSKRLRNKIY